MSNSVVKISDLQVEKDRELLLKSLQRYTECMTVVDRYGRSFKVDKYGREIVDLTTLLEEKDEKK